MKTPLLYGLLLAIFGALLTFGLFFAGMHDTPEKLKLAQLIGGIAGLVASVVCYALAMREARVNAPTDRPWGYGSAFGCGVLTALWATVFNAVVSFVYFAFINPAFCEMIYQVQLAKAQQRGMTEAQLEQASRIMHAMVSPLGLTISNMIVGFIISVVVCLIIAIFFAKPLPVAMTTDLTEPPTVPGS